MPELRGNVETQSHFKVFIKTELKYRQIAAKNSLVK